MGYRTNFVPLGNGKWANATTGEVVEGIPVYIGAKVKWSEGWFMGIQEAFSALAKDKDFTGEAYRVLNFMFSRLGFENYIALTQAEIATELAMQKQNVSRAIQLLGQKGIIKKGPKLGRSYAYKLNSSYGWKGRVKNLAKDRGLRVIREV